MRPGLAGYIWIFWGGRDFGMQSIMLHGMASGLELASAGPAASGQLPRPSPISRYATWRHTDALHTAPLISQTPGVHLG